MAVPASRDATLLIFTDSEHNGIAVAKGDKVCCALALPSRGCEREFWGAVHDLALSSHVERKDFSRLVVSAGPGSFTGIRLGMAAAEGLSLALSCELVAVDRFQQTLRLARTAEGAPGRYVLVVLSSHLPHECFAQFFAPDGKACSLPFLLREASWSADLRKAIDSQSAPCDVLLCGEAAHTVSAWFAVPDAGGTPRCWRSLTSHVVSAASPERRAQALLEAAVIVGCQPSSQILYVRPLAFVTAAQRLRGGALEAVS
jgi:tRNA threonylcarbamoyl adenosine modification protein YeaZ